MAKVEHAVLGGGCFWCLEAVYKRVEGISLVVSGYAGGNAADPSYEEVCRGTTGHAEVIEISFDPDQISYRKILQLFFKAHDPTTLNRQGADTGTQYRSIILYNGEEQRGQAAEEITRAGELYDNPVVTELVELTSFYPAEAYHQNYYDLNTTAGYCRAVIRPKLAKMGLEPDSVF